MSLPLPAVLSRLSVGATALAWLSLLTPALPARAAGGPLPPGAVARLSFDRPVTALAFAPDGRSLALACQDGREVGLWDVASGRPLHRLAHAGAVGELAWSPDGQTLACACRDGAVYLWDAGAGRERRLRGHTGGASAVAFAPDGKLLASGGADGTLRLWDAASGEQRRHLKGDAEIISVAFAPDGKLLAVTDAGGARVRLLDPALGTEVRGLKLAERRNQLRAVFGPGGRLLASWGVGRDYLRDVCLWDLALGECRQKVQVLGFDQFPLRPCRACFSPDGQFVAVGGPDRASRLWEVASGQEVLRLRGHHQDVHAAAFGPDGRHLATGGADGTALVWDLRRCALALTAEKPESRAVERWWADLGGPDAARAYRAGWLLADEPGQVVTLARRHLRPVPRMDARRLQRLLADLDHDQFAVREKAEEQLRHLGRRAEADLRHALATTRSPEVRRRAQRLLVPLEGTALPAEERLACRAVALLERLGTDEARRLVAELADGCPTVRQTRQAGAALARLKRRQVVGAGGRP